MQQWSKLSDPAMEEALRDVPAFRDFAGLFHWDEHIPSELSILRFRHLLEHHKLADQILAMVNAALTATPTSPMNEGKARDPKMHQSKKGNQRHFGMKAHIGVDADSAWCTR